MIQTQVIGGKMKNKKLHGYTFNRFSSKKNFLKTLF